MPLSAAGALNTTALAARAKADPAVAAFVAYAGWFFGQSSIMRNLTELMLQAAGTSQPVLLCGESGVGKGFVARCIHNLSGRPGPFVTLDISAIPVQSLEAEMDHQFTAAASGTLYVLGMDLLPHTHQKRFLTLYQKGQCADLPRLICPTCQRLDDLTSEGLFLEQLYRALNPATLVLPALNQRKEDLPLMAYHFLQQYGGRRRLRLSRESAKLIQEYPWPGNVREMAHVMQRVAVAGTSDIVTPAVLRPYLKSKPTGQMPSLPDAANACFDSYFKNLRGMAPAPDLYERVMSEVERPLIEHVLRFARGNQLRAADILGLNRNTLRKKIRLLDIDVSKLGGK